MSKTAVIPRRGDASDEVEAFNAIVPIEGIVLWYRDRYALVVLPL